jgi:hypothetical protein
VREALDEKKYAVADVTAGASLLQSILDQLYLAAKPRRRKLSGVDVGALGFNVGVSTALDERTHGFRYYLTLLAEEIAKDDKGIVFLIDEVHRDTHEMREFATTFQHLVREKVDVALLMAGLPQAVNSVLNDKILTFLHRAHKVFLGNVDTLAVENLYETVLKEAGAEFESDVPFRAAVASQGFPYLIQLLGHYLWKSIDGPLTQPDLEQALINSKIELFQNVHALIMRELSERDRAFLFAMTDLPDEAPIARIITTMGVTPGYVSRYRQRLADSGVIRAASHGKVKLLPPYMKEYLIREQRLDNTL